MKNLLKFSLIFCFLFSCTENETEITESLPSEEGKVQKLADQLSTDENFINGQSSMVVLKFLAEDAKQNLSESEIDEFNDVINEPYDLEILSQNLNVSPSNLNELIAGMSHSMGQMVDKFPELLDLSDMERKNLDELLLSNAQTMENVNNQAMSKLALYKPMQKFGWWCLARFVGCIAYAGGTTFVAYTACLAVPPVWQAYCFAGAGIAGAGAAIVCADDFRKCKD